MNNQKIFILWLTGLSASGKTTLGKVIKKELDEKGYKSHHLDGDEVRDASLVKLGFSKEDRDKNISLAIDIAKKYQEDDCIVIASFISPYKDHRKWGRERLENFIEVFIDTSLEICEERDPKGMYKKARAGEIEVFTGISDPYENPDNPDIHIKTENKNPEECVQDVIDYLEKNSFL